MDQISGQMGHVNQINSYTINQYGTLSIGQIQNNNYGN